jgi:hypothetical protein
MADVNEGDLLFPDDRGRFGDFGGKFIPETLMAVARALCMKSLILAWSFLPFVSTPLETSTPQGCTLVIAFDTFSGVRPPASKNG